MIPPTTPDRLLRFAKGHGTENDFIVLPDPEGQLALSAHDVMRLCDRRTGIGADGVLRAVRCAAEPQAAAMADAAEWFMDFRNADGSEGAMCGNGIRVLARHLVDTGLARPGPFNIATRAGVREVRVPPGTAGSRGAVGVLMGHAQLPGPEGVTVRAASGHWPALHVDMGNPHAVVLVDDLTKAGDLRTSPVVDPPDAFPFGVSVEFVTVRGPEHLAMRVYERGVGETRSCGTGACAAVAAVMQAGHRHSHYAVDIPGGRLDVTILPDGGMELLGAAIVVAAGTVRLPAR